MPTRITKWLVPALLMIAVAGFSQGISVEHESIPERQSELFANSKLHFELKNKHYDHALAAMMLSEDIDLVEETTGTTALGLAAQDQSADAIDVVKPLVLKFGANLKLPDAKGFTPLHYAAKAGNLAVVEFLVDHGADVDAVNQLNERVEITPLYMARLYARPRIVEFLRMRGAHDLEPEVLADVELTESMAKAAREVMLKRVQDARLGRKSRNVQEDVRQEILAITGAAERTLRKNGNFTDLEAIEQYRKTYMAAIDSTDPDPGMSVLEYSRKVDETVAGQSPDGTPVTPCRACPRR